MSNKLLSILNQINSHNYFGIWQALHWYCNDNHDGQFSTLYSILSQSPYQPAHNETSAVIDPDLLPFDFSFTEDNAPYIYCALLFYAKAQAECDDSQYIKAVRAVENLSDHYIVQFSGNCCSVYNIDTDYMTVTNVTKQDI